LSFLLEMKAILKRINIFDLSAQLSYYLLMSFFPFLLLMVTLFGYLPFTSKDILHIMEPYIPYTTYELLKVNLQVILGEERDGILSLSLIITLYLTSVGFYSIIRILNQAYQVKTKRPFWKEWILGIFLMFGLLLAFVIVLMLSIFGPLIHETIFSVLGIKNTFQEIWISIQWLFSSLLLLVVFLSLYLWAPNTKVRLLQGLPGALFSTLAWQLSSFIFSYFVSFANYSYIYGNLGGAMILLGWFYWSAFVLILGGQMNAALCKINKV
jgi:membrane protein